MANTFTCFEKFAEAMEDLTEDERHQMEIAICEYGFFGVGVELPRLLKPTFKMIKDDIDNSVSKRGNGAKGGRPKKGETTDSETEKPVVSENAKPNTIQNNTVQDSTEDIYTPAISEIVDYLNAEAHTSYRSSTLRTRRNIKARLKEGFTVQDFKDVIDGRIAAWANDPKMSEYIRPETLFGSKFEGYLNASKPTPKSEKEVKLDETFRKYEEYSRQNGYTYNADTGVLIANG